MKTVLVAIDSKYIHTNLAVRLLQANTTYETVIKEFTIKDSLEFICAKIEETHPEIVAFSAYIWNIELILSVSKLLKSAYSPLIIYGGPEVSYDALHYMNQEDVDFIIRGEGEFAFHELLDVLHKRQEFSKVSGLVYRLDNDIILNPIKPIEHLSLIKSPYRNQEDVEHLKNKIQYIETSRGCPFHCSYCLASLEKGVRYFDIEQVKTEIKYLLERGAKTFKFLDRTFNINPKAAESIFDFIIENASEGLSFQFEITGDLLGKNLINYLNTHAPKHLFRFEIGIQSTSNETNLAVDRIQDNRRLFDNIRLLKSGNIVDLHLDLIAGLPYESLSIFEVTFNEVFHLYCKELQLGFLKMLRGTKIRYESDKYHYRYHETPPYEILENHVLSVEDVHYIHQVESMLEIFWNKGFMNQTIEWITRRMVSPFVFFHDLYLFMDKEGFDEHRYQLPDIFNYIDVFVKRSFPAMYDEFTSLLKREYLIYHSIKPKIWWSKWLSNRKELVEAIHLEHPEHSIDDYYKYGIIIPYIDKFIMIYYGESNQKEYLITI